MFEDVILTPDEVAEFMKLTKQSVMFGYRKGEIPGGFKIRNQVRFSKNELMKFIKGKTIYKTQTKSKVKEVSDEDYFNNYRKKAL